MTNEASRRGPAALPPDLSGLPPCSNSALRRATRQVGQLYDAIIAPSGLRAAQFGILVYIAALDQPTMKTLARALVMDLSALGHTLKPLVRNGYVQLSPDAADRRAKRVSLTESGKAKMAEAAQLWQVAQTRFDAVLGIELSRQLRDALVVISAEDFAEAFKCWEAVMIRQGSKRCLG